MTCTCKDKLRKCRDDRAEIMKNHPKKTEIYIGAKLMVTVLDAVLELLEEE